MATEPAFKWERYTSWSPGTRSQGDPNHPDYGIWHEGFVVCETCGSLVPNNKDYRRRHDNFHDGED